jgi:hypothetical protein
VRRAVALALVLPARPEEQESAAEALAAEALVQGEALTLAAAAVVARVV